MTCTSVSLKWVTNASGLLTWFSCPVKYPSFRLHSTHASLSSDAAACSSRSQLSMNSFEYSRVAPKSTSSTCRFFQLCGYGICSSFTNLPCLGVPEKIGPIRICLHGPEFKEFLEAQFHDPGCNLEMALCQKMDFVLAGFTHIIAVALAQTAHICIPDAGPVHPLHY
jgi:hypothetical protein